MSLAHSRSIARCKRATQEERLQLLIPQPGMLWGVASTLLRLTP